jgi:hypothetical protein
MARNDFAVAKIKGLDDGGWWCNLIAVLLPDVMFIRQQWALIG